MRGLTSSMQMMPAAVVVLSLVVSGVVEGQQQAMSPAKLTPADRKVDLIERQQQQKQQQPGYAPPLVREADDASRLRSEPSKNTGDINNNVGSEHRSRAPRRSDTLTAAAAAAAAAGEAGAIRNGRVAGSTILVELAQLTPPASSPEQEDSGEEPPSRNLQEDDDSCALAGAFTVSSTVYRAANGCYFAFLEDDPYSFVSSTGLLATPGDRLVMPFSSLVGDSAISSTFVDVWLMAEVYDVSSVGFSLTVECQSYDVFVEGSHPSDVSAWSCFIAGGLQIVAGETFGITCGCEAGDSGTGTTPAPGATAPTPVDADSPAGASGCGGTDPFAIVSAQLAELDGCYQDTGGADDGDTFFSATGEKADGVLAVYPAPFDEQAFDLRWIVGTYSIGADSAAVTCVSDEAPSDAHPADATFYCDLTGTGAFTTVTEDQFGIVCGCNGTVTADGTAAPTTTPDRGIDLDPTTPSPAGAGSGVTIATPSPAGTEDEVTIADDASSGGPPVAPAPHAWLSSAATAAAVVLTAVLMGVP